MLENYNFILRKKFELQFFQSPLLTSTHIAISPLPLSPTVVQSNDAYRLPAANVTQRTSVRSDAKIVGFSFGEMKVQNFLKTLNLSLFNFCPAHQHK